MSGNDTPTPRARLVDACALAVTLVFLFLLFRPGHGTATGPSLMPGADLPTWDVRQVVGNLAALAGVGVALGRRDVPVARIAVVAVVLAVAIEAAQHALATGRVASIDDVLVNAVGATLAAAATRRLRAA